MLSESTEERERWIERERVHTLHSKLKKALLFEFILQIITK